ncbi:spore gernimation protein [Paenibacillus darwinianus]|uniref:Spore gernimation protein n=1 Tax=Paenibacillus darwinianus TaxID=1380763 RepID=A0A9W5S1K5_9BACL|nr:endospore germination permease [Paenibacillus darwinianus]EXX88879.1 spore gernimation protein [Paenibacillus darwinianus]EXX89115.1 spore gernimation protein [Paenibacillus darwinianus]EXX90446.1 spore gernimation protein [Paenibacillus darwinianus]
MTKRTDNPTIGDKGAEHGQPAAAGGKDGHDGTERRSGQSSANRFVISPRQSASIVASTIFGVGVLTLPRTTTEIAGESGWLSTVLGACLAMVPMLFLSLLARMFPGKSIVRLGAELFSPVRRIWIGKILILPFLSLMVAYWTATTGMVARIFGEVVTAAVLPRTPVEVIIGTMLLTGFILVMHDIETVARVNEILLPLIVVPILLISLFSYQSARLDNLFPLFAVDWMSIMRSSLTSTAAYLGFEVFTLFMSHAEPSRAMVRANLTGIAIPGFMYTLIVISGISVFGVDELKQLVWPTLELVKTTEMPGLVLERTESLFIGVWVTAVFTTVGTMYFTLTMLLKEMLGLRTHRWIALAMLPALYWVALRPQNIKDLFDWQDITGNYGSFYLLSMPILFWLIAQMRPSVRRRNRSAAADSGGEGGSRA